MKYESGGIREEDAKHLSRHYVVFEYGDWKTKKSLGRS
jgi:hypothetical protein